MSPKHSFVLVPGAWHSGEIWNRVATILEAEGHQCIPLTLPSTTSDPSVTLDQDIETVRRAILSETAQGRDVIVGVHSYGGLVGSSAIKGLTQPSNDGTGRVIGLAMMASFFNYTGKGFVEGLGGKPPKIWRPNEESGFAVLVGDVRELFYHDLPDEDASYWRGKLQDHGLRVLLEGGEFSYSGWKDVPVWHLHATEDRCIPIEVQRKVVGVVGSLGANVTVRDLDCSHSPMLSRPKETAEFLLDAAAAFAK